MIKASNLSKSYGGQVLFEGASFNVNARERIGLVGRNGHGKTTLFRMIMGLETADSGQISKPRNYRLGHLEQHLHFSEATVLDEACLGLQPGFEHDAWRAEKILSGLGFSDVDMSRPPAEFSGGYQVRLNLAKVLVSSPDLLLLDEPTNYLDIVSIRWLERFLRAWKSELMLITHDRSFMDAVTTHTLGIHRKRMRKIHGDTTKYYEQIASEEEVFEKTRLNDEKRRKEVELFINRFRAKARLANMVQSRIKTLEKKEQKHKLEKIESLEFSFRPAPFRAKIMLDARDLAFRYEASGPNLIEKFNLSVAKHDRICIVGKNGKGKTTLLKMLAGILPPRAGEIATHPSLLRNCFEQTNTATLDPHRTIEDEIAADSASCTRQMARDIAGAMMFSGDQALKKISVLSGGEKSRVLLGKLLVSPAHLLLLDEPTNHLDMEACDSLMAAIDAFDGAVILVTHNEMFLHTLANRLIVFDRGRQFVFEGGYGRFLEKIGWEDDGRERTGKKAERVAEPEISDRGAHATVDKKAQRKRKAELLQEKSRVLNPLQRRVSKLEKEIEQAEDELGLVTQRLVTASTNGDAAAIAELAKQERDLRAGIEKSYEALDRGTLELEQRTADFEKALAGI